MLELKSRPLTPRNPWLEIDDYFVGACQEETTEFTVKKYAFVSFVLFGSHAINLRKKQAYHCTAQSNDLMHCSIFLQAGEF